ncbi:MAG: GDP-L-fucose synthase [Pseudomonadota bacterium]
MTTDLKGKRVTITGGAGFLGSFVVEKFKRAGAEVYVPLIEDYDLTNAQSIQQMYQNAKPQIVVHLAAQVGGIGANQANPGKYFYDNLMMGVQLMHEGWKQKLEKFVAIGTICAYPKFAPIPFKEEDIWNGYPEETNAPYGLAKKMLLVQSMAYREQYNYNSIVLFPVNLYGPRDNFHLQTSHVIPAIIRKALTAKQKGEDKIVLWGDGSPTREFLYVEDAAEGILLATQKYDLSEPVNLGNQFEISIRDLAQMITKLCEFEGEIVWDASRPNGQPRRCLDVSRARERFGFVARTPLVEGMKKAIEWFRSNQKQIDQQEES